MYSYMGDARATVYFDLIHNLSHLELIDLVVEVLVTSGSESPVDSVLKKLLNAFWYPSSYHDLTWIQIIPEIGLDWLPNVSDQHPNLSQCFMINDVPARYIDWLNYTCDGRYITRLVRNPLLKGAPPYFNFVVVVRVRGYYLTLSAILTYCTE